MSFEPRIRWSSKVDAAPRDAVTHLNVEVVSSPGDRTGDSVWTAALHLATELHTPASFEPEIVETFGGGVWRAVEYDPERTVVVFNVANYEVEGSRAHWCGELAGDNPPQSCCARAEQRSATPETCANSAPGPHDDAALVSTSSVLRRFTFGAFTPSKWDSARSSNVRSASSMAKVETGFHHLVMFGRSAELANERFTKGDNFIAEGYQQPVNFERDGQPVEGEEFVAKRIGHDVVRTRYDVDRSPRKIAGQDSPAREQSRAFESPAQRSVFSPPALGL